MRPRQITGGKAGHCAFTLVEMLVSMAIITFLLVTLLSVTNHISGFFQSTKGKIEQFREARSAFESISRRLSQATLNAYWDYDNPQNPVQYIRQSELRFISGPTEDLLGQTTPFRPTHGVFFFAPLGATENPATASGLEKLLNACGYFIEYDTDADFRPTFLSSLPSPPALRSRFRLMEWVEPAEKTMIYNYTTGTNSAGLPNSSVYNGRDWFQVPLAQSGTSRPVQILAENIIALVILPRLSTLMLDKMGLPTSALAPTYLYDSTSIGAAATASTANRSALNSKNQLPPMVQLTMVAIDELSADRLSTNDQVRQELQTKLRGLFASASNYDADIADLGATLAAKGIKFRVFTTNIVIQGAKWSTEQTN